MALSLGAALIGSAVIGGASQAIAGGKAAKAAKNTAAAQIAEERRQYDTTRADYAPWREAGSAAISKMAGVYGLNGSTTGAPGSSTTPGAYGGFFESPDYQYRKDEAIKAANRGLASRGLLGSGGAVIAKEKLASNLAAGEYGDWWNRLAGIAGVGQTATAGTAAAGEAATSGITRALGDAGAAKASSYTNTASAINGGINNVLSAYFYRQGNAGGGFGG